MTENIKLTAKQMWLPVSAVGFLMTLVFTASVYIVNLANTVQQNKETVTAHIAMDDARTQALTLIVNQLQTNQVVQDSKFDSITKSLDQIKEKLNIN